MKVFISALPYHDSPSRLASDLRKLADMLEEEKTTLFAENCAGELDDETDFDYQIEQYDCVSLSAMFND